MNHKTLSLLSAAAALSLACSTERTPVLPDPVDCVNPLCGTASTYHLSTGNTYPAVALPWGTHFWTPQTGRNGDGWTYTYSATRIRGFKQTHQPSPWINDYGAFSIMPVTTGPFMDEERRQSWFSHKAETATPYYYKVYLAEHDVVAELAPTERAAAFRFTYPERDTSYLVVDAYAGGQVQVDMERNVISGCSTANHGGVADGFGNWFVIESDTPFCVQEVEGSIAMVGFRTVRGQEVCLRVASSFISPEQAVTNLGELGGRTIDEVAGDGRSRWNEVLGRIKAEDDDIDNLRTFYSCLYRSLLFPRDLSEVDASGERIHRSPYDGGIHKGYLFGDTGFWDTFRCLFPLLDLVYPDQEAKMQEGLVNTWLESGFLPEWASPGHRGCMVGNNSASVVAGAFVKGIRGHDAEQLWKAVTHGAHAVHPSVSSTGRLGWEYYDSLGYVPCDVGIRESAARTLEYSYDDWCIYTFGKALGKSEEELAPYAKAALNYRNLFDPAYGLMAGRKADGEFARPFSPLKWGGDFTEGNSLHYTWSVFHDPDGLIELMGGEEGFTAKLDSIFTIPPLYDDSYYGGTIHEIREMQVMNMGNYAHGNQPIQHMLYLYDWGGQPWKAQQRIREVMDKFYNSNFDGYCGDEDNGQTSAWYVFSAMGFYPVCPASDEYAIGTPLFKKVTITFPDGKKTVLSAPGNSRDNFYIDAVKLDGKRWDKDFFTHRDLSSGVRITYSMSPDPNKERGTAVKDRPYSFSRDRD
ncbi:MAG: GH92 family glycosyl hydrolase [Bacteroidales bacterium]|nr:GH92 family glycosyl hydrolase [Bacteroidales bacterium]